MGFRNIMISSNMKLRIQDQQLVVTAGDEVHIDRKSTRLNSSHVKRSRMPSSA